MDPKKRIVRFSTEQGKFQAVCSELRSNRFSFLFYSMNSRIWTPAPSTSVEGDSKYPSIQQFSLLDMCSSVTGLRSQSRSVIENVLVGEGLSMKLRIVKLQTWMRISRKAAEKILKTRRDVDDLLERSAEHFRAQAQTTLRWLESRKFYPLELDCTGKLINWWADET